jgi:hypothetical protein
MKRRFAFWVLVLTAALAALPGVLCGLVWWSDRHPIPDGDGVSFFILNISDHGPDGSKREHEVSAREAGIAAAAFIGLSAVTGASAFLLARGRKSQ